MPKWFGESALNPDGILPAKDQWRMQWDRIERWFERVLVLKERARKSELTLPDLDEIIDFFQNAYHLRDWIAVTRPNLRSKLTKHYSDHIELKACRDICNGYKHKFIDKPSLDSEFNFYRIYDHFELMSFDPGNPMKYKLAFELKGRLERFEVFELAEKCHQLLKHFVTSTQRFGLTSIL